MEATLHFLHNAHQYGVDATRVAVIGDSAGGNLAAAVALKLRQMPDVPQPLLQVLAYPSLQMFDLNLPSYVQNDGAVYGTKELVIAAMFYYIGHDLTYLSDVMANNHTTAQMRKDYGNLVCRSLLPVEPAHDNNESFSLVNTGVVPESLRLQILDPYFMPLMAGKLTGLPKAYIITAGYDVLRDDGILYAERLLLAGVPVTWKHYPNAYHGFLAFIEEPIKTQIGLRAMDDLVQYLKAEL